MQSLIEFLIFEEKKMIYNPTTNLVFSGGNFNLNIHFAVPISENITVSLIGNQIITGTNIRVLVFEGVDAGSGEINQNHFIQILADDAGGTIDHEGAVQVAIIYNDSKGHTGTATRNYADHNKIGSKE